MEDYDGWITVGTGLDSTQLEKDLKAEYKRLEKAEKDFEKLTSQKMKIEAEIELKGKKFEEKIAEIEKLRDIKIEGNVTGGFRVRAAQDERTRQEAQIKINRLQEEYNRYLDEADKKLNNIENDLERNTIEQQQAKDNINEITEQLDNMPRDFSRIFNGITKVLKQVKKWGLAIFGIRSAYMAIRQAMSVLSSVDEQLKTDLQYIRIAMATALEPIVKIIVEWALRLLQIIGAIIQKLTGKNPFEKVNENLKKANGSAKQLSKTLASFDEMNIVGDNSSSGIGTPSIDITGNFELPTWMEKILEHKDEIVDFLIWLASMFLILKVLSFAGTIEEISVALVKLLPALEALSGLQLLGALVGIALVIVGIIETIKAIIGFIKDPSWENFANILKGLAIILAGVALAMIAVNIANPVAWIVLAIAAFTALMALIIKNWDKIKAWFNKIGSWVQEKIINPIKQKFNALPNWLKTLIKGMVNTAIQMINMLINGINLMLIPFRAAIVVIGKVMGKNWSLQTISIPKIPYVRKGAIINQPNRGVDLGVAKGGESGHEGVVPLTDSQQMALLGAEIGKNVVVNLTNIMKMNGRELNRELKRIASEDAFAGNYEVV